MAQLGELFPSRKLGKVTSDEDDNGEKFERGPLDLESGVVRFGRPAPRKAAEPTDNQES
ncbi:MULTISPECIES: hypothetical protein [unclassified Crossiella]|uniref:hypothetical protein n=1 Tax=unclassified Crossiella TaxID=2620835 RepID=UPI001FFEB90F|nr:MULTISPECIES: hypothetical protein [unclassified Crossiella]MCK2238714.1 hypothetical protein [Crossiella sp. S99.2]MCK2251716.1 hypothetical protein [Crossiella sp. S99.1]